MRPTHGGHEEDPRQHAADRRSTGGAQACFAGRPSSVPPWVPLRLCVVPLRDLRVQRRRRLRGWRVARSSSVPLRLRVVPSLWSSCSAPQAPSWLKDQA